jgi:hypothetical protein
LSSTPSITKKKKKDEAFVSYRTFASGPSCCSHFTRLSASSFHPVGCYRPHRLAWSQFGPSLVFGAVAGNSLNHLWTRNIKWFYLILWTRNILT